jgi:hypothetical protein
LKWSAVLITISAGERIAESNHRDEQDRSALPDVDDGCSCGKFGTRTVLFRAGADAIPANPLLTARQ